MNPRATLAAVLSLASLLPATTARAEDEAAGALRTILGLDLRARAVRLMAIDSSGAGYIDDAGQARTAAAATLVAILPSSLERPPQSWGGPPPPAPGLEARSFTGLLTLTDGQRFPGQRAGADERGESLVWRHPRFGRISVPIDSVAAIVLDARALAAAAGAADSIRRPVTRDTLLLSNGDTVTGFLSSLGEPIEIETDAGPVFVPNDRVVALRTANPPSRAKGAVAWFDDGTVASVDAMEAEGAGAVAVRLAESQTARYAIEAFHALAFDAARIVPLASLAPRSQAPVGTRSAFSPIAVSSDDVFAADASPLGAGDIELPGPMTVAWALPLGARRFAAVASIPPAARPWGDCVLVVRIDGSEALRERLSDARPSVEFALPASGAELTVTVEPGEHGPINDRVVLQRALILLEPPAS